MTRAVLLSYSGDPARVLVIHNTNVTTCGDKEGKGVATPQYGKYFGVEQKRKEKEKKKEEKERKKKTLCAGENKKCTVHVQQNFVLCTAVLC